jgi:hypothetical protein
MSERVSAHRAAAGERKTSHVMSSRGYMLVDFGYPRQAGDDCDAIIRFMEYVRINFHSIVPNIPTGCELDVIAGGTAHNVGIRPLLGLHLPPGVPTEVAPFWEIIDTVMAWSEPLPGDEFWAIVRATGAPTWAILQSTRCYPVRLGEA